MDPFDPTRREPFWIDTLKTRHLQGVYNIDPHHYNLWKMFIFVLLEVVCFLGGNSCFTCYIYFPYLL